MFLVFYNIVQPIIKILFTFIYRPQIESIENVPSTGPFILAGNHTNNRDCLLLISSISPKIAFLGKHTLLKGPLGPLMKAMGVIPVDRTAPSNSQAMATSKSILESGGVVALFPEGTINRTKDVIMPFKMGAVALSSKTNSPIITFVITGNYRPFRKSIKIKFLQPQNCSKCDLQTANDHLMMSIRRELERKYDENKKNAD